MERVLRRFSVDREVWRALVEAAISARMAPETKK